MFRNVPVFLVLVHALIQLSEDLKVSNGGPLNRKSGGGFFYQGLKLWSLSV